MQLGGGGAEPECVTLIPVAMRSLEGLRADPLWNKFRSSAENRVKHGSVCENSLRGGAETTRGLMKPPRCHSYHHEEEEKSEARRCVSRSINPQNPRSDCTEQSSPAGSRSPLKK